ncbi:hypothetical protein SRHO_G00158320 [Serrasalmus rhombeus]
MNNQAQEHLKRQRDILAYRMKKLSVKQMDFSKKTEELKDKIKKKYDDMKRVLDEDLRITLCQLDMEEEAMERVIEENIERCYHLTQDLDQQLAEISTQLEEDKQHSSDKISVTEGRHRIKRAFFCKNGSVHYLSPSTTPQLVSEVVLRDEMRRISEELERLRRETVKPSGTTRKRQQLDGPSDSDLQRSARRATAAVTPPTPHAQATGTATSTAASTTRRLSLPCYNGDADWAAFEAQLEVMASCEGWSDAEAAAQLCLALQGPALRVLVELPADCRRELAPLKRALMTRFGRQPDESAAKLLLANRRRNRGERIGVLASEVALLVRQAYPSFPREAQQQLSLDHFVRALEPGELRMHVRLANPITIDAAVDEATRAETILSGKGDGWDATARPRVGPPDKKLTCWRCGEIGHKANTCKSSGNETGAAR